MIEYKEGNLLDVKQGIIVHGVNAQGVMGAGVALAIKKKYPKAYEEYLVSYNTGNLYLGSSQMVEVLEDQLLTICNACTQEYYGTDKRQVNYAALCMCFTSIFRTARIYKETVHFPKIGAGLAGGDWDIIEQLINDCDPHDRVKKVCWTLPDYRSAT